MCIAVIVVACATSEEPMMEEPMTMEEPFGGADDVVYAKALWEAMELGGFNSLRAPLQPGKSPHGAVIEILEGTINDKLVVVKRNYGGEGVSVEAVEMDRAKFLAAITVMAKRDEGYDVENSDWFWAKYLPSGEIDSNPMGVALAGRVAKGMDSGCISCHQAAIATDLIFAHDENNSLEIEILE